MRASEFGGSIGGAQGISSPDDNAAGGKGCDEATTPEEDGAD